MGAFVNKLRQPKYYLILAILIFIGRSVQMNLPDILVDDAFVSFRYAVNLSQGKGLVFNPGERVEGYTNFLWTVLLAGFHRLGLDLITSSKILNALAAIGTMSLIYQMGKQVFMSRRGIVILISSPILLFAVMGSQARYVMSGMETLLFMFLLTLATYFYLYKKRPFLAGLMFALLAMTRPEGIMYFTLVLGYDALMQTSLLDRALPISTEADTNPFPVRGIRAITSFAFGFLLLYGAYFIWRYNYYGYLLPNTFYAKAAGFHWKRLERGWEYLRQLLAQWRILPILIVSGFSLLSLRRNRIWLLFLLIVTITFVYFVYVGGDFIVWFGPRFLMPVLPFILLMCVEGLARVLELRLPSGRYHNFALLGLSALLLIHSYWFMWPGRTGSLNFFSAQMRSWAEMGLWIAANTPTDTTIATDAAGLIPYYSERYAIDMFGLTDLHIAHLELSVPGEGVVAHEKFDPVYILSRGPDCIVSTWIDERGRPISAGLLSVISEFETLYELVAVAKVKYGPPVDSRWVIATSTYTPELFSSGYVTGLFCRKQLLSQVKPRESSI